jgi:hypothetical protein
MWTFGFAFNVPCLFLTVCPEPACLSVCLLLGKWQQALPEQMAWTEAITKARHFLSSFVLVLVVCFAHVRLEEGSAHLAIDHRLPLQRPLVGLFLSFPYVCPEPVLVKRSFSYMNG